MSEKIEAKKLLDGISNNRWRLIAVKLDSTYNEIMNDLCLFFQVVANELMRLEDGKEHFAEIGNWSAIKTQEFVEERVVTDESTNDE